MTKDLKTILIVDDSIEMNLLYANILSAEGYTVVTAGSAEVGLQKIKENADSIGFILLDCFMPGMSGEDFIASLQKNHPDFYERTVIYAFSCLSEDAPQAKKIGELVDGFFEKPDSFTAIVDFVKTRFPLSGA